MNRNTQPKSDSRNLPPLKGGKGGSSVSPPDKGGEGGSSRVLPPDKGGEGGSVSKAPLLIFFLFATALALALLTTSSLQARLLEGIFLISLVSWILLTGYFTRKAAGLKDLSTSDLSRIFFDPATTAISGEALLSFTHFKLLRKQLLLTLFILLLLPFLMLLGLRTLPVPTFLFIPLASLLTLYHIYRSFKLSLHLLPSGSRLPLLTKLLLPDYRTIFARHAQSKTSGEVTVSYSKYKRLYKVAATTIVILIPLMLIGFGREIYIARLNSEANLTATSTQLNSFWTSFRTGQGNTRAEFNKLLSQALQPAVTLDQDSLTRTLLSQLTASLPEAKTITTLKETETIVEKSIIHSHTKEVIKFEDSGYLSYQDEQGTTFLTFGGSPKMTLEEAGIFNIKGTWQIDGAEVTATASELNNIDDLSDAPLLVLEADSDLNKERVLTAGTNISLSDGGENQTATISLDLNGVTYTWPSTNGTASQYLQTNGSGTLSWATVQGMAIGNAVGSGTANSVLFIDASGNLGQDNTNFTFNDTSNYLSVPQIRAVSASGLKLYDDGGAGIFVEDGGQVGINTTAPTALLHINGTTEFEGILNTNSNWISGDGGAEGISIDASGNVGIGTTDSLASLDVIGATGVSEGTASYDAADIAILRNNNASDSNAYLAITAGTAALAGLNFGDKDDANIGRIVYDNANNSLDFYTNNSEQVTIDTNGNVGIGTTAPGSELEINSQDTTTTPLHVVGASGQTEDLFQVTRFGLTPGSKFVVTAGGNVGINVSSGTPLKLLTMEGSGTTIRALLDGAGTGSSPGIEFRHDNNSSYRSLIRSNYVAGGGADFSLWTSDGSVSQKMVIQGDGNVGIGTTAPQGLFHLRKDSGQVIARYQSMDDASTLRFISGNSGLSEMQFTDQADWRGEIEMDSSDDMFLKTQSGSGEAGLATRMIIKSDGNVGIGTTAPGALLDLSATGVWLQHRVRNTDDPTGSARQAGMDFGFSDDRRVTFAVASDSGVGSDFNGKAYFYADGNPNGLAFINGYATNTEISFLQSSNKRLTIEHGGNIGIRTDNPKGTLHLYDTDPVQIMMQSSSASANNSLWDVLVSGEQMSFRAVNDNNTLAENYLAVNRTNHTIDSVTFPNGNVGIGTTSPASPLHVVAPTPVRLERSGSGIFTFGFQNPLISGSVSDLVFSAITTSSGIGFVTRDGSSVAHTAMVLDRDGNVGIGTAAPGNSLHVIGTVQMDVPNTGVGLLYDAVGNNFGTMRFRNSSRVNKWTLGKNSSEQFYIYNEASLNFSLLVEADNDIQLGGGKLVVKDGGNVGIGTTAPNEVLEVNGRIRMNTWTADGDTAVYKDDTTGNLGIQTSDIRLKKNLEEIDGALDIISAIKPYKFHMLDDSDGDMKRLGLVAQEVFPHLPEMTFSVTNNESTETYLGVHYDKLPILLLAGLKEQQLQINSLADLLGTDLTALSLSPPTDPTKPSPLTLSILERLEALEELVEASGLVTPPRLPSHEVKSPAAASPPHRGGAGGGDNLTLKQLIDDTIDALYLTSLTLEGLEVKGDTTLFGDLEVEGESEFKGDVIGTTAEFGELKRGNEQLGRATIPKGGTQVAVKFKDEFKQLPVVQVSTSEWVGEYRVTEKNTRGFIIQVARLVSTDTVFDWMAISGEIQQTDNNFKINETSELLKFLENETTPSYVPQPNSSPFPTPTPATTPSLSPTPNPTITPTSSPSPNLTTTE